MSNHSTPKARRDYRCFFCGLVILKGCRYVYVEIKPWDHPDNEGYAVWKIHRRCDSYWSKIQEYDDESPYYDRTFHRDMARERFAKVAS